MPPIRSHLGRRSRLATARHRVRSQLSEGTRASENAQRRHRYAVMHSSVAALPGLDEDMLRTHHIRATGADSLAVAPLERASSTVPPISRLDSTDHLHARTLSPPVRNYYHLAFCYNPAVDYSLCRHVRIGAMTAVCPYCKALKFLGEVKGICCAGGKIVLPPLAEPPEPLKSLLAGTSPDSQHFLSNIRKYNSCFQMTSFGAEIINTPFMPTFKVRGQIYHRAGSLLPLPPATHKFLQIYFIGSDPGELDVRCRIADNLNRAIVAQLQELLHAENHLVRLFKTALDMMPLDSHKIVIHADKTPVGEHVRRYNAPSIDDVAIVIAGDQFQARDIVLHRRTDQMTNIADTHRCYDALQYPLMFWDGADGYHFNIKMINAVSGAAGNKKCSAMHYYSYRLMIRQNADNPLLKYRLLFHQYVVDMYAKIESERLLFLRLNQKKLRSEDYVHLRDAVLNDGNTSDVGRLTILPSSYTGSPRHMHEYAQDAIAYVRNFGRPDLFITFTCNPHWEEIQELLLPGQLPHHRHDITARVFRQKLKSMMAFLFQHSVFGSVRCWMYSVEWQKRGLPHSHVLLWLHTKLRSNDIDTLISAEIPDAAVDSGLHEVVTKHMIHGPCGTLNPKSPCMIDGKCSKRYPRALVSDTITGNDGYPLYRRRSVEDGGRVARIRLRQSTIEVDNRWIVPYSPLLSKAYKAHINVEYCNSVKSIKYICKYVNKGNDMAIFNIQPDVKDGTTGAHFDEITQYQAGRYISSNEAVWRILSFPIHERSPPVVHLSVHLENGQRVYFTSANVTEVARKPPATTLTAFFALCHNDAFAATILYSDVPRYYTWNARTKSFERRKRGERVEGQPGIFQASTIGRLYTVHPTQDECFFLRLLLINVTGPTSFQALRTVNGITHPTFRSACHALHLLENDHHWDLCLHDACHTSHPHQIRSLFAVILTSCSPSSPLELWEKYKSHMTQDVCHRNFPHAGNTCMPLSANMYNEALLIIETVCLNIANKYLTQLGMPAPLRTPGSASDFVLRHEQLFNTDDLSSFVTANVPKLTVEQHDIYNKLMQHVRNGWGGCYFLDAPGGTGKTFLISLILATIRSQKNIAIALASSGIAATLLPGGRTAHSALKLPLNIHHIETPMCNISKTSGMGKLLQNCKLIVWDECTMAHKKSIEALDRTLQDLRGNSRPFGNALIVLAGDFRQTLPVIPRSTPADEINACLKYSHLWHTIQPLKLSTNMRIHLRQDSSAEMFSHQLLAIGNGTMPVDAVTGRISLPPTLGYFVHTKDDLVGKIFPDVHTNYNNHDWLRERAILAATNKDVNDLNDNIQSRIHSSARTYKSVDTVLDSDESVKYPTEFLNSLDLPGMPPHLLHLKMGVPVIILRNISPPKICNGTRLAVKRLMDNLIEATILSGPYKGEDVLIPRIPMIPTDMPFNFKRLQFPIRVAFALTINKAQGQSLEFCGLFLHTDCFSHGQLYVACSRVGTPHNLYICTHDGTARNIVYPQALSL